MSEMRLSSGMKRVTSAAAKVVVGLGVSVALLFGVNFVLAAIGLPFIRAALRPTGVRVSYLQVFHALNFVDIVFTLPLVSLITAALQRVCTAGEASCGE